ncbi:MAG: nitroreductase family protein [Promethearchaeota archaeon]
MLVIGIDKEKCSNCKECIRECGRGYFFVNDDKEVVFNEDLKNCILCGHCIAICPEDAIITQDIDDVETYPGIDCRENIINYEKIYQFLRAKRSMRRYKDKPIPRELIEKVFKVMRYAPSSANSRMWHYLILSDPDKINKLSDEIVKTNYAYMGYQSGEQALKAIKARGRNLFFNAPHVIVLYYPTVEKSTVMVGFRANDAGIALTYGMLAAESLGLGTCWIGAIQGTVARNHEILDILGIKGMILGTFTLGYPAVKYQRTTPRSPLKLKGFD